MYINRPCSIEQLKDAICQEITAIPHEMTHRVIDYFHEHLRQCVDNNGSHLTGLILKPNETKWHYMYFSKMKTLFCLFYLAFIKPTNVSDHFAGPCTISTSKVTGVDCEFKFQQTVIFTNTAFFWQHKFTYGRLLSIRD